MRLDNLRNHLKTEMWTERGRDRTVIRIIDRSVFTAGKEREREGEIEQKGEQ